MSHTPELTEYTSHHPETTDSLDDALFLERLDTFMQKSLNEIKAFAERESKTFDQTRRYVAEWHAKTLFSVTTDDGCGVRNILIETSKVLESLSEVTGVQSFILAVNPHDPQDAGFLGGSLIGREFYRGIRGGGSAGASSFKAYAQKRLPTAIQEEIVMQDASTHSSPAPSTIRSARQVKVELYESIRSQLRKVSGIRKAEMKWTNPERLNLYGVRLVGWPSDIPAANPSSLKANQNQRLLELVEHGELRFEKTMMTGLETPFPPDTTAQRSPEPTAEDFSWAYDADGGGDASVGGSIGTTGAAKLVVAASSLPLELEKDPMLSGAVDLLAGEEHNSLGSDVPWKEDSDDLVNAQHNGIPGFDEYGFNIEPWNPTVKFEDVEEDSPIEPRARKRARSSEPEA
ncbi:hypothetical protein AN958_12173 [Leucoagaricus sp. SymC.cos]|nr:hypothetical protein AN958_12173 [Leucoagaricus sp. SymC.cos]